MFHTETGAKYLTVARLLELLAQLPPETRLYANRVTTNLVIYDESGWNPLSQLNFNGEGGWESLIIDEGIA